MNRVLRTALGVLSSALLTACSSQPTPMPTQHALLATIPTAEYDRNILGYAAQAYPGDTLDDVLAETARAMEDFVASIPEDSLGARYRRGAWTVGEVLQHVISYEHIMAESALMIAGRAPRPLRYQRYTQAGTAAGAVGKSRADLLADFRAAHAETVAAFAQLSDAELRIVGRHEGFRTSPRVLALCLSGHQAHHFGELRERYGVGA